jgi:neopullulanase
MKSRHGIPQFVLFVSSLTVLAWAQGFAATQPVIRKIEPPNWWVNYTADLTLLITGENLSGASVESSNSRVVVKSSNASTNGNYLFVHLRLAPGLHAGEVNLEIKTPSGSASVQLPLLSRANPAGHFEGFSRDDVIYLIMPDRFADGDPSNDNPPGAPPANRANPRAYHGGDLRGIRDHLGYLHDLGVTTLWLTPVWKNTDSDYHGYHCVDFYAIDEHMGTMEDYQLLVADAHKLGMKVLIDYVANHTGPHHPWANDPPTPTWFHGAPGHHLDASYKFNGLVDPHASPRESRNTLEGWFANKLPDLNPDDPALATYLAQNALWWTEIAELDGFRLDTFPYSSRQFWGGWHARLHEVYPHIDDVGEVADPDSSITAFFAGGRKQFDGIDTGLSTVFDFAMRDAIRDTIIKGDSMQEIVTVLQHDELYPQPDMLVTFFGNHDNMRFMGEKNSSTQKLKAAFSLLLTMRGIPQIYSGDEIAMDGATDPDNRHDFPGGFPDDPRNAFTTTGRTFEQEDVFNHVQALLTLRRDHPALRTGKQWHIGWDDSYYAFIRDLPEERIFVVYNNGAKPRDLEIPIADTPMESARELRPIFGSVPAAIDGGNVRITIPSRTIAVFTVR